MTPLAERLAELLPQTQCQKCGYKGCAPYADAMANKLADINRCPPGGTALISALSKLTGREVKPLNPACGPNQAFAIAAIDATRCIGCTLCIEACPVDAIIGAARRLHLVIDAHCTGCERCIAPCPVDCIDMQAPTPARVWTQTDARAARLRHQASTARSHRLKEAVLPGSSLHLIDKDNLAKSTLPAATPFTVHDGENFTVANEPVADELQRRRALVDAALVRVRERRRGLTVNTTDAT